jgi:hypothetical protein
MDLLPDLGELARAATDPAALSPERRDKVEVRARQRLRELAARLRRRRKAAGGPSMAGLMVRSTSRLNADWGFLGRELEGAAGDGGGQRAAASALGQAFEAWAKAAAAAIQAHAPPPPLAPLEAAVEACRDAYPGAPGMAFLTQCLLADARGLALGLARTT